MRTNVRLQRGLLQQVHPSWAVSCRDDLQSFPAAQMLSSSAAVASVREAQCPGLRLKLSKLQTQTPVSAKA